MGEYAIRKSDGQEIKIGTCEQMYYLRADQVDLIRPLNENNVNPQSAAQAEKIRFRFPFPQEDRNAPGEFEDYDYGLGLYGIEPPEDIEHSFLQFTRNYPQAGGITLSTPCPRSKEGKAAGLKINYNGYNGPVAIHSQRLVGGKLVLIMRCGDCGALWRIPTLEDAQPVLKVLVDYAAKEDAQHKRDEEHHKCKMTNRGDYYREVSRRIVAGYTEENFWTKKADLVLA